MLCTKKHSAAQNLEPSTVVVFMSKMGAAITFAVQVYRNSGNRRLLRCCALGSCDGQSQEHVALFGLHYVLSMPVKDEAAWSLAAGPADLADLGV